MSELLVVVGVIIAGCGLGVGLWANIGWLTGLGMVLLPLIIVLGIYYSRHQETSSAGHS